MAQAFIAHEDGHRGLLWMAQLYCHHVELERALRLMYAFYA